MYGSLLVLVGATPDLRPLHNRDVMESNTTDTENYEAVINMIRAWPAAQRLRLLQDVLVTLGPEGAHNTQRQPTLSRALGLLAVHHPAPSDEEIAALLDERRQERYGL
jgi:hypothetical protein